jgi:tricorn protease
MKRRGEIYVVDTSGPPGDKMGDAKVSLGGIVIDLDPREEWAQMFYEAWRQMRDFYWDPQLGGHDWKAIRDQYATLLPRLATRGDLQDLIGELIGEMNTSHTYVFGGDPGGMGGAYVATGLLGADVVRDGAGFRVTRIYRGDPADNVRSALAQPGADVREGDVITAVNHVPFPADRPFLASLEGLAGKDVVLTVRGGAGRTGERDVVIVPMTDDSGLRYADWVRGNREYVAKKTGGKIGYVHLPNMWTDGLVAFNTWFYPQLDREGMVIDVRWNGGGAVSQMILERLRRSVVSFDRARGGGISTYPYRVLNGPFVVVTNEFAGSDGDIFPRAVQITGLAPVIGQRSWGGVVGIRADKTLVDGGMVTHPEFAWWEPAKGWTIENHGVDPDIDVQNMPQDVARGVDAQLDRAISEVLSLHQKHPPIKPDFGPANPKTRDAYKQELTKN